MPDCSKISTIFQIDHLIKKGEKLCLHNALFPFTVEILKIKLLKAYFIFAFPLYSINKTLSVQLNNK